MDDTIYYINTFIEGNNESFEKIVIKYERLIYSFISSKVPEKDVDDIVQETFIKVFINCSKLKNPASFKAWLFAICRNCINNYLRDKNNKSEQLFSIEDLTVKEEFRNDENPIFIIRHAINQMPLQKQPDLFLKYICGFSYREIAALYGISENLVKSRLFEYRKTLKQIIENHKQDLISYTSINLKECIMEKIELIKQGADIITGLSLDHQIKLCGFVKDNQKFDAVLLEGIGKLNGGTEFVTSFNGKLSLSEFADLLCFINKETVQRIFHNYRQKDINFVSDLNKEMSLSDLKILENKSLVLKSERIAISSNSLIVSLNGYIDTSEMAKEFEIKMISLIESGYVNIILDCRDFTYIISTGIGALIVILKKMASEEGNFIICNLNPLIWEVFSLLGISRFFIKKESLNQAIEYCANSKITRDVPTETISNIEQLIPEMKVEDKHINLFCYYKDSQKPSYSYFDYKALDNNKWAIIKAAVAGKGGEAAAISSLMSSNFHLYFEHNSNKYTLNELVYMINSRILKMNFHNRFAVLNLMIIDGLTGECSICSAGDHHIPYYNAAEKQMRTLDLPETPALGMFPNDLIRAKSPYLITKHNFKILDTIYLLTEGLEESRRGIDVEPEFEDLGIEGIFKILNRQHKIYNSSTQNPEKIVNGLIEEVKTFRGDYNQGFDYDWLVLAIQLINN